MTRKEAMVLLGIAAYISYAIENKLKFGEVLMNVAHDVGGMARYPSIKAAEEDCFLPRTHSYGEKEVTKGGGYMLSGWLPKK